MKNQSIELHFPDTTQEERRVLADAVMMPESFVETYPVIHSSFFTNETRRKTWDAIVERYNAGRPYNSSAILQAVGPDFVAELGNYLGDACVVTMVREHAAALRNAAARRRSYIAAVDFMQKASDTRNTENALAAAVEDFSRKVEGPAPLQQEAAIADVLHTISKEIEDRETAIREGHNLKITTGFSALDRWTYQGFGAGQLVVLAARPSVGKTAIMLHMAKAAAKAGNPVTMFSLEMTSEELGQRLLFSTGQVRPVEVATGRIEWQAFENANGELSPLPIYINDFSRNLDEIVARITQSVKQGRCSIAFIDYLGLFADCYNFGTAKVYQIISKITGTMKALAKRLRIPIVLLCQLNRDQAREKRSPELYDLRDSGSIEQDSDIVLMLEPNTEEGLLTIWVRKNRQYKRDLSLIVRPNETYSAFEEVGVDGNTALITADVIEPRKREDDNEPF